MSKGMGGYERPIEGETNVWLTPKHILDALGQFDMDPCAAPEPRPWDTATYQFTEEMGDGLEETWYGCVWMNPPYGKETGKWLNRLADHGDGVALIFARTETKMFFDHVWNSADAVLFLKGRLTFVRPDGTPGSANAGAPSVLVAYGKEAMHKLADSCLPGKYIELV